MTDRYYSTATEAGAQAISDYVWRVLHSAMIGLGKWTATGTYGEALGWINKPDGTAGDPEVDPITGWLSPALDSVTGCWLVKSSRNYLIAEAAIYGGLDAAFRPDASRLDSIVPVAFADSTAWVGADGADLHFLQRTTGVAMREVVGHIDRKAITRNRHASGSKDTAFITSEQEAA